jgi:hypothetical protein
VPSSIIFITDISEFELQEKANLLYCYASWMPEHQQIMAMLADIQVRIPTLKIFGVDIQSFGDRVGLLKFRLASLPGFFSVIDGEKKLLNINELSLSQIEAKIVDIYLTQGETQ